MKTQPRDSFVSRRGLLKGALAGVAAMTLTERLALARMLVSGPESLTVADIQGAGVEPGKVVIDSNENPLGPSPSAIAAVADHLQDMNRYDWGSPGMLGQKLATLHGLPKLESENDRRPPLQVLVEGGSGYVLKLVAVVRGVADGQGESIESEPGYGSVSRTLLAHRERFGSNTKAIRVPTNEEYVHDLDAMRAAITPKTTLIVVTNPNNPAGTIVPFEELRQFVDAVPKHITILIDEAYIHFVREPGYKDAMELAYTRENVLVTRTFSKIYGLAGMRVGYVVGNPKLLEDLAFYGNSSGVSKLSCYAAAAALDDHAFVRRVKKMTDEGKDYLYAEFDKMGLRYTQSHSSFVQVDLERDAEEVQKRLAEKNVMLGRYGLSSNPAFSTLIRFTVGTPEELEVAVRALKEELA